MTQIKQVGRMNSAMTKERDVTTRAGTPTDNQRNKPLPLTITHKSLRVFSSDLFNKLVDKLSHIKDLLFTYKVDRDSKTNEKTLGVGLQWEGSISAGGS